MAPKRDDAFDRYWRFVDIIDLDKKELARQLSRSYPTSGNQQKLMRYATRVERHQINYNGCTNAELQQFVRDRKFRSLTRVPFGRRLYIDYLEVVDDKMGFTRFTKLPPEPRNMIYEYAMGDYPDLLYCPTQPPLTRVCRAMRVEALPIFFDLTTFVLKLDVHGGRSTHRIQFSFEALAFLSGLSDANCGMIRSLQFDLAQASRRAGDDPDPSWVAVRLLHEEPGYEVEVVLRAKTLLDTRAEADDVGESKQRLEERVGAVMQGIAAREGKANMKVLDIYALRSAIDKGYL